MPRAQKIFLLVSTLILMPVFGFVAVCDAAEELYQEGVHYIELPQQVPTSDPARIEVVEVFKYHCPYCFRLKPTAEKWFNAQPEDVVYVLLPGDDKKWEFHARAFYTAKKLDVLNKLHTKIFDAIHVDKKELNSEQEIGDVFVGAGVNREKFSRVYNSTDVTEQVLRARSLVIAYKALRAPRLVVNGKYLIPLLGGDGHEEMLDVAEFLVQKERKKMRSKKVVSRGRKSE